MYSVCVISIKILWIFPLHFVWNTSIQIPNDAPVIGRSDHPKSWSNEKILLTKVVRYASGEKNHHHPWRSPEGHQVLPNIQLLWSQGRRNVFKLGEDTIFPLTRSNFVRFSKFFFPWKFMKILKTWWGRFLSSSYVPVGLSCNGKKLTYHISIWF